MKQNIVNIHLIILDYNTQAPEDVSDYVISRVVFGERGRNIYADKRQSASFT